MNTQLDYEAFEKDWKKRHKASLPRKVSVSGFAAWFWIAFWVIVAGGAAVFSAAHTIPAAELTLFASLPYRGALAVTAFVIVEFVIFGAAAKRHEIIWMKWLLAGSLLVALIGNTSSSVKAVAENGGDTLNQVAGVLLSVIAPFTALAAGEVLHLQLAHLAEKRRIANEDYQQQWKEVEAKINTAFSKEMKALQSGNLGVQSGKSGSTSGKLPPDLPDKLPANYQTTADYKKNASVIVQQYLLDNPDAMERSNRDIASELGVSHPIVGKIKNEMLNGNGHIQN
jgi:hypothetical protein